MKRVVLQILMVLSLAIALPGCGKKKDIDNKPEEKQEVQDNIDDETDNAADNSSITDEKMSETDTTEKAELDTDEEEIMEDPLTELGVICSSKWGTNESIKLLNKFLEENKDIEKTDIAMVNANDFDHNGTVELFVFVQESYDVEFDIYRGALWFVTDDGCQVIPDSIERDWTNIAGFLDFEDKSYMYMNEYYVTASLSYVWDVQDNAVVEAPFSKLGDISQTDDNDFTILVSDYDNYLYDGDEFMLGHTWKPYYFYYDNADKMVHEYGAARVYEEDLHDIFGEDIAQKIGDDIGIMDVMYRENGILTINTIKFIDGGIEYGNINYDCKKKTFLDAWGTGSGTAEDSNHGGTYLRSYCPMLATLPDENVAEFIHIDDIDVLASEGLMISFDDEESGLLCGYDGCDVVDVSNGNSGIGVLFMTDHKLADFKILNLEYKDCDDNGNISYNVNIAKDYGTLDKDMPLVVHMEMIGTIPNAGFSFADTNGNTRYYSISESGMDGSPVVTRFER